MVSPKNSSSSSFQDVAVHVPSSFIQSLVPSSFLHDSITNISPNATHSIDFICEMVLKNYSCKGGAEDGWGRLYKFIFKKADLFRVNTDKRAEEAERQKGRKEITVASRLVSVVELLRLCARK